jgi:AraC-like DNA-binding protein
MPSARGLLTAVVTQMFDDLGVSVALWLRDSWWQAIHFVTPSLTTLEREIGVDGPRYRYNDRCLARVVRARRPVIGEHRGYCDLFLPVTTDAGIDGVLVAGPFARKRPSSGEILQRWLEMTRSHGRLSDPSFDRYVSLSLSVLTLDDALFASFQRLMTCFVMLASGKGDPNALGAEARKRRQELVEARLPERMWALTRSVVDERSIHAAGLIDHGLLAPFGVDRIPQGVLVGLLERTRTDADPTDDRVRVDAFLRACVALARRRGDVLVGPVAHNGLVILCGREGARARSALIDLNGRVATLARRFGFAMHGGIADTKGSEPLAARYLAALRAAEKALADGRSVVAGEPVARPSSARLRKLRGDLERCALQGPSVVSARFEEYIQAVLAHTGYRLEPIRGHLDAGFERLVEPIASDGLLDERSVSELWASIERAADGARTVAALTDSYRRIVDDLGRGLQSPTGVRRERSMRRALSFVREHLGEPLPVDRVAKAAGFAPKYFSKLFHEIEGIPYGTYVRDLRLARAKEMLKLSRLTVDRVGRSCGFRTRTHFHRAFRRAVGVTPIAYRTSG